jgi:uncharacterized protein (DUF433 family)
MRPRPISRNRGSLPYYERLVLVFGAGREAMTSVLTKNPNVLGGRPVFRGTRVPVETVFENLADGLSVDEIVESYPSLDKKDVIAILEQACERIKAEAEPIR